MGTEDSKESAAKAETPGAEGTTPAPARTDAEGGDAKAETPGAEGTTPAPARTDAEDGGAKAEAAESKAPESENKGDAHTEAGTAGSKAADTPVPRGDEAQPEAAAKPPLLVVADDDAEFTQGLRSYFEDKGMQVEILRSKEELAAWAWDQEAALFVVAQNLGGEDGRSLALDAREQGKLRDSPVVIVTSAEMDKPTRQFTLKLGFRKILVKPFGFDVLERLIADEPRVKAESAKAEATEKKVDRKTFEERKAAVLRKMGLDEGPAGEESAGEEWKPASEKRPGPTTQKALPPTARVPSHAAAKGKTTTVVSQPGQVPALAAQDSSLWAKGVVLGFVFPFVVVAVRALLLPWGYASPVVIVEGAVLGLLAGMGLTQGLKRMSVPPPPAKAAATTLCLALAVWGISLGLRSVLGIDFVERSAAAKAHLGDPDRQWGVSEWMAVACNAASGILTFAGAIFVLRFPYRRHELAASAPSSR